MKKNKWIGWRGGETPVHDLDCVVAMFRNGHISSASRAGIWDWHHYGDKYDIVAYRLA